MEPLATAMKSSPITPISDGVASQLLRLSLTSSPATRRSAGFHRWLNSPNVSNNVCSRNSTRSTLAAIKLNSVSNTPTQKLRHLSSNSPPRVPQRSPDLSLPLTIRRILSDNTSTELELQLSRTAFLFPVSTAGRQSLHLLSSSPTILRLVSNRCHQTSMSSSPLTHCLNELLIQVTPIRMNFAPLHRQLLLESASRRATVGQSVGKAPDEPLSRGSVLTFSM